MSARHEFDDDACCIHCGHDGAEEAHLRKLGYEVGRSSCSVWDERVRAQNRARYQAAQPSAGWDDQDTLDAEIEHDEASY